LREVNAVFEQAERDRSAVARDDAEVNAFVASVTALCVKCP